jgi:hypothetical protein
MATAVVMNYAAQSIDLLFGSVLSIFDVYLETRVLGKSQYQLRTLEDSLSAENGC